MMVLSKSDMLLIDHGMLLLSFISRCHLFMENPTFQDRGHTDFITKFGGATDLMQRTPAFWRDYVQPKLDRDFASLHRFLNQPFPTGRNWYVERIEANMGRIQEKLAAVAR